MASIGGIVKAEQVLAVHAKKAVYQSNSCLHFEQGELVWIDGFHFFSMFSSPLVFSILIPLKKLHSPYSSFVPLLASICHWYDCVSESTDHVCSWKWSLSGSPSYPDLCNSCQWAPEFKSRNVGHSQNRSQCDFQNRGRLLYHLSKNPNPNTLPPNLSMLLLLREQIRTIPNQFLRQEIKRTHFVFFLFSF